MAAMDFFTVPIITLRVLYCFFVISHSRRKILHCNATEHPTSAWIAQQIREAFQKSAVFSKSKRNTVTCPASYTPS